MLEHHKEKWGDKVRICGVSIDKGPEIVSKHVEEKKWKAVEHFHRGASTSTQDYGVSGVPKVVLIDTEGNIAFIGHPAERKLEEDIETLLKGEKLKGIKSAGGDEGGEDEGTFKTRDLAQVDAEIAKFDSTIKAFS